MGNFKKEVFGEDGMLHQLFGSNYEVRHEQVNMSIASAKTIMNREILLAEGATGVGKSFAYMIPCVSPATRQTLKGPVVISTSTKVLQDQIYGKDVQAILKATDQPLDVVLAKGRNNYISVRRLDNYLNQIESNEITFESHEVATTAIPLLTALHDTLKATKGEFANFGEDVPREIRAAIESTDSDCHGEECESFQRCPYQQAKQHRKDADILIVNHALLAMHIAFGRVLPKECSTYIIDEAHKFFDAVSSVFEIEITLRQVHYFMDTFGRRLRGFREHLQKNSVDMAHLTNILNRFEKNSKKNKNTAIDFFSTAQIKVCDEAISTKVCRSDSIKYGFAVETPNLNGDTLTDILEGYVTLCGELRELFNVEEASEDEDIFSSNDTEDEYTDEDDKENKLHIDIKNLSKEASSIHHRFISILNHEEKLKWCYWSEVSPTREDDPSSPYRLTLKRTPIDISEQIAPLYNPKNAVVFTSATLQVSNSFSRIRNQLGLIGNDIEKKTTERLYPSPFPYRKNVEIHLFNDVLLDRPNPHSTDSEKESYWQQQTILVEYYLRLRSGRALVLCSSNKLLHELYERLEPVFKDMNVEVFRQIGTDRLKDTVEAFKADKTSVLFGVASCWEGLDAPGTTLETVIIPQLPFAPPHPLIDARKALLDDENNWFKEISLPDMLLHLKQGAGRLMRSKTDQGVIVLLSPRPLTKRYGKDIRSALPPGRLVRNPKEALSFLRQRKSKS